MINGKVNNKPWGNSVKLFLRIFLLLLILCIVNNFIFFQFHLPRFWAVDYAKSHFYSVNASKYNTVFIGSSLTCYQIDPAVFDSINKANAVLTKSFNYGIGGACPTEILSTYNYVLANKSDSLKNIFCELTLIDNFDMGQMHSLRRTTAFDMDQYRRALPLTLESNYDWDNKKNFLFFDLCNLTEGIFKINMFKDAYDFTKKRRVLDTVTSIEDFTPLSIDDLAKETDTAGKYAKHLKFLNESLPALKENTANARKMFEDKSFVSNAKTDCEYMSMAKEMLDIAKKKGIRLIFILPPRLSKENYEDLLPVYYSIPDTNRLQLADANEYPEFYTVKNSFDIKHINKYCVPTYTGCLAGKFLKIVNRK